jgi:hypothetical protein
MVAAAEVAHSTEAATEVEDHAPEVVASAAECLEGTLSQIQEDIILTLPADQDQRPIAL